MNIRIVDGKTIIKTDRKSGETINKTKVKGLTYREKEDNYTLSITYQGKKYHIGNYKTIEEGKSIRRKADKYIEDGTFVQWIADYSKKRVNEYGVKGLYRKPGNSTFQMNISYKNKKYFIGTFRSIDAARIIREEADASIEKGTFLEWLEDYKSKKE